MARKLGKHRLSMDIPEEMWMHIKSIAEKYNITATTLLKQILFKLIIEEQKYENK